MAEKKDFVKKEKASGVYLPTGENISFNVEWSSHRFTDQEVQDLLAGKEIAFTAVNRSGNEYTARGILKQQEYNGHAYWGFSLDTEAVPVSWAGHTFTEEERQTLRDGGSIYIQDAKSRKTGNQFACTLSFGMEDGRKRLIPKFDDKG